MLAAEKRINGRDRARTHPAWGEDIKIMGARNGDTIRLTVACATISRYLPGMDDYFDAKAAVEHFVRNLAIEHGFPQCLVHVNTADDPQSGAIYLTVTAASAEAGDDGQVGRRNRANGLFIPYRPMMLEAVALRHASVPWARGCYLLRKASRAASADRYDAVSWL